MTCCQALSRKIGNAWQLTKYILHICQSLLSKNVDHCLLLQQVDSGSKSTEEEAPAASGLLRLELLHCGSNSAGIVDSLVTRFCYFLQQEHLVDLLLVDTLVSVHCCGNSTGIVDSNK